MIFVVSKYENWARNWFEQLANRMDRKDVDGRHMKLKVDGETVQFMGEHRFEERRTLYEKEALGIIHWNEGPIDELEMLIQQYL